VSHLGSAKNLQGGDRVLVCTGNAYRL
jgi:hypothetical protein